MSLLPRFNDIDKWQRQYCHAFLLQHGGVYVTRASIALLKVTNRSSLWRCEQLQGFFF